MYRPDEWPGAAISGRLIVSRLREFFDGRTAVIETGPICDADLVGQAAAIAAVSEFDLFRAAWRSWHGSEPSERRIEPLFARYLQDRRAPGYVRHFARRVVESAAAGQVARDDFGIEGYRTREPLPDLSCRFSAEVLACALIAVIVIAI